MDQDDNNNITIYVQRIISKEMNKYVGSCANKEDVKLTLEKLIKILENQNVFSASDNHSVKTELLWKTWSFRKKLKWYVYNNAPFLRDSSEQIRRAIDSYNEMVFILGETMEELPALMDYPEHLIPNPKNIIVSSLDVKLNTSVDFIPVDLVIGNKK